MSRSDNATRTTFGLAAHAMRCLLHTALLALCLLGPAQAQSEFGRRVALVIGNAGYAEMPLRNPGNDAQDLSAKLRELGFQVTTLTDRNRSQMTQAIRDFGIQARGADAALFYFAGHGVQVRGRNFLLPVGQRFATEAEVETDAVDVNSVLARLDEAGARVSLLILDACRNNPLPSATRSSARGLARMEAPSGALVAFAAQPGNAANDGTGRNGTYTHHLLRHIGTPGLPVEQMFKRVRADVERETGRAQSPREESSLTADFYFANPFTPVTPANREGVEDAAWGLCRDGATRVPCDDYLSGWPQGRYAGLARTRIRDLLAAAQPASPVATSQSGNPTLSAAGYPNKAVNYILPFAPGGESELSARLQEPVFKALTGQTLTLQYKPGAGGALSWAQLNGMSPDGYTVMGTSLPNIVLQPLQSAAGYKTDDITTVFWFNYTPDVLMVPADSPIKTLRDFVAAAKAAPGATTLAGSGTSSANHLAQQRFDRLAGIKTTYVPYRGVEAASTAMLRKEMDGIWGYTRTQILLGSQARCLGVAMEQRHPKLPDCPTFREQGLDLVGGIYRGVAVPKSTPADIQAKLAETLAKINADPGLIQKMEESGFAMINIGPAQMGKFMAAMKERYGALAK